MPRTVARWIRRRRRARQASCWPVRQQPPIQEEQQRCEVRDAAARLLPERHPRHRRSSASRRASSQRRSARTSSSRRRRSTPAPTAIEALFAGALDATFIGPNPAINAVPEVERRGDPDRLRRDLGRRVPRRQARDQRAPPTSRARSSPRPQLGNTQDVALRTWLKSKGLKTDTTGGGDVHDRPAGQRADARRVQGRRDRRRLGARAVGDPPRAGGRRQGPRRRGATCGRTGSSSPPT